MNHRSALKHSTDIGLTIFVVMIVGVVLWTTDEVLGWNLLPDRLDKYAQLIVIVLSMLACIFVVISVMCSMAVLAEAAAGKSAIPEPKRSRSFKHLLAATLVVSFLCLFVLHRVDTYREHQRKQRQTEEKLARHADIRVNLERQLQSVLDRSEAELQRLLSANRDGSHDAELARFLASLESSLPHHPAVQVMVRGETPYLYGVFSAHTTEDSNGNSVLSLIRRQFLDLPTEWERTTTRALFDGAEVTLTGDRPGEVLNNRRPLIWRQIRRDGEVIAVLVVRGSV